jgi:hypothetical protein
MKALQSYLHRVAQELLALLKRQIAEFKASTRT